MSKAKTEQTAMVPAEQQAQMALRPAWCAIASLADAMQVADMVAKGNALPDIRNAGQALLKIMAGAELGFGVFASLTGVHIIEGKPSVGAHLIAAAIRRSGLYDYKVIESTALRCELQFFRVAGGKREPEGVTSLTMEEAKLQGFAMTKGGQLKDNYRRHPKDMLFARCLTQGYRQFCPDVIGGGLVYTPDELDRDTADPVIEADFVVVEAKPSASEELQAAYEDAQERPLEGNGDGQQEDALPEVMVSRFAELVKELNLPGEALTRRLKETYGVDSFRKLNTAQADEVTQKLRTALEAKQAKAKAS